MSFDKFIKDIKKVNKERHHKVTNSYGSKDAFFYYRKIKPIDSKYVLTDCQYLKIIRLVNNILKEKLMSGYDVILPERMGMLELRKHKNRVYFKDNKLHIKRPVNWNATLKLWYENPECKNKKQLVREDSEETFRVFYNRRNALYINKMFYEFKANRTLKIGLKKNIKLNKIDAFAYGI